MTEGVERLNSHKLPKTLQVKPFAQKLYKRHIQFFCLLPYIFFRKNDLCFYTT